MTLLDTLRRRLAAFSALIILAGCGGSGPLAVNGGVGSGGTGISWGSVTGFGSLLVDGVRYDSATGTYLAGTETSESAATTAMSVDLGNQLQIELDAQGKPATVQVDAALIGVAGSIDAALGRFVVNGMTVRTNTNLAAGPVTYYSGMDGFGPGLDGSMLEIHGIHGIDGANHGFIQATLVRRLPLSTQVRRITGRVEALDTLARTFRIGGMSIDYTTATRLLPSASALANGALVNVWSTTPESSGRIAAEVIRVRTLEGLSGSARISGLVSSLSAGHFMLSGIPVDASLPALATHVAALVDGDYTIVTGSIRGGEVVASGLASARSQPEAVELHGTISAYVSNARFLVRGVAVDASLASFPDGPIPSSNADDTYVEVTGRVVANKVDADTVRVLRGVPEGVTVEHNGTVSGLSGRTFTLTLRDGSTRAVTLAANASFEDGSSDRLVNGANVEIEATSTSTGLLAYSVEFRNLDASDDDKLETRGLAYDVSGTRFSVNGLVIEINGQDASGLAEGVEVEVHFVQSGGLYLATEISVEDD